MARISELAMASGSAKRKADLLKTIIEAIGTVEYGTTKAVTIGITVSDLAQLREIAEEQDRTAAYWQKRIKRGR